MTITNHIDTHQQRIEIRVAEHISAESAFGIIQHAIVEAYGSQQRELVLDLRAASFDPAASLFRLHSLLQSFKSVILQKALRVIVLFASGDAEQWMSLDRAEDFDGITLRYFTDREAACRFLGSARPLSPACRNPRDQAGGSTTAKPLEPIARRTASPSSVPLNRASPFSRSMATSVAPSSSRAFFAAATQC